MNNLGRPTLDKKEQTLKVRINDEERDWIEDRADAEGVSMSEYIRWLIDDDMSVSKNSAKSKKERL